MLGCFQRRNLRETTHDTAVNAVSQYKYLGLLCLDTNLCHFTESSTFLAEVNHDATAAVLRLFDGLLNAKNQIRATGANVRAKNITPVTL